LGDAPKEVLLGDAPKEVLLGDAPKEVLLGGKPVSPSPVNGGGGGNVLGKIPPE